MEFGDDTDYDALCVFDTNCVRANDIFLITGNDNILANAVMNAVCQQLRPCLTFVNLYTAEDIPVTNNDNCYENYIPESCIYRDPQLLELESFLQRQKEMIQTCMNSVSDAATRRAIGRSCHTLLILDRCPGKWYQSKVLERAIQNRNALQLTLLIRSTESITKLPSLLTQNVDFCFVLSASVGAEHNKLYNTVAGFAPTIREFRKLLQTNIRAEQYCMVIDHRHRSYSYRKQAGLLQPDDIGAQLSTWSQGFARFTISTSYKKHYRLCDALWNRIATNDMGQGQPLVSNGSAVARADNVFVGNIPTLLDVLQNYGHCAEDERIQITIEIIKKESDIEQEEQKNLLADQYVKNWLNEIDH